MCLQNEVQGTPRERERERHGDTHTHTHRETRSKRHGGYIINQLELLSILTALLTFPELFRNRLDLWFVDNCALSACVHGYADKLDMAKMANSVRLALCSLGVRARFDWVPTDANIADTPSRVSLKEDMSSVEEAAWNSWGCQAKTSGP